jgi:hypothetical protein
MRFYSSSNSEYVRSSSSYCSYCIAKLQQQHFYSSSYSEAVTAAVLVALLSGEGHIAFLMVKLLQ